MEKWFDEKQDKVETWIWRVQGQQSDVAVPPGTPVEFETPVRVHFVQVRQHYAYLEVLVDCKLLDKRSLETGGPQIFRLQLPRLAKDTAASKREVLLRYDPNQRIACKLQIGAGEVRPSAPHSRSALS